MPLVRIDLPPAVSAAQGGLISRHVHQALVDIFQVPAADLFHVVTRHPEGEMVVTPEYLGIPHGPQATFVQIACSPGRTLQQKRDLYARIAADVSSATGIPRADVIVNLVETHRENWSFGEGVAQYML